MGASMRVDILALDLATTTGWARGSPDDACPTSGFVRFGNADSSENAVFAAALGWFAEMFGKEPRPTMLMLERMLPPQAKVGATSTPVRDRLAGLHGVARAVAHRRGIYEIATASALDVRQHFCHDRHVKKQDVYNKCQVLGWPVTDLNESDACAIWSYACGLIRPDTALRVTPMFGKRKMAFS
jgi:hypothetical protein